MGMFDYINYETQCPKCRATLTNCQSKDAACEMETLSPDDVSYFYVYCNCGCCISFSRVVAGTFERTVTEDYGKKDLPEHTKKMQITGDKVAEAIKYLEGMGYVIAAPRDINNV